MSTRKQPSEPEDEITAQPRPVAEELTRPSAHEPGLSVDPEDLGAHFLNQATEQNNFESSDDFDADDLAVTQGPPSDEALSGPSFEPEREVWEQTVDLALQSGGVDQTRPPAVPERADGGRGSAPIEQTVDVHGPGIREASLFDEEGEQLGETRSPRVETEDDPAADLPLPAPVSRARGGRIDPIVAGLLAIAVMSFAVLTVQASGLLRRRNPRR